MNAKLLCFLLIIAGASCAILPFNPNSLLNAGSNILNRRRPTTTTTPAPTTADDESSEESSEESSTRANPLLPLLDPLQEGVTILDNIRSWVDQLGNKHTTSTTAAPRRSTNKPSTTSAAPAKRSSSSSAAPSSTSAKPSSSSAAPSSTSAKPSSSSAAPRSTSAKPSSSSAAPSSTSAKPSSSSAAPSSTSAKPSSSSAAPSSSSAAPSSTTEAPSRKQRDVSGSMSIGLGNSSLTTTLNINLLNDLINALKSVDLSKVKVLPPIPMPQLPTLPDIAEAVKKARQLIARGISDVDDIQKAIAQAVGKALRSADVNGAIANLIHVILKTAYDVAIQVPMYAGLAIIQDGILIAQAVVKAILSAATAGLSLLGNLG